MKTSFNHHRRILGAAALAVASLLALPTTTQAKDHGGKNQRSRTNHNDDSAQRYYSSQPRSSFTLTLGTGYAGRGYYYGPPNSAYYYQGPNVMYYATREAAPRAYYSHSVYSGNSTSVAVQRALARNGYYHGYIDGQIGRQSSRAIASYQQDRGLRVTGGINQSLLRSLGLD